MLLALTDRPQLHLLLTLTLPALPGDPILSNPTPYFSRDCPRAFVFDPSSQNTYSSKDFSLPTWALLVWLFPLYWNTPFHRARTSLINPRKPTKLTRLTNFRCPMSCECRRNILKNNADFGFRVWTRAASMGPSYGSDGVIRWMAEGPKARDCYFTVSVGQGNHWGPVAIRLISLPLPSCIISAWLLVRQSFGGAGCSFGELLSTVKWDSQ